MKKTHFLKLIVLLLTTSMIDVQPVDNAVNPSILHIKRGSAFCRGIELDVNGIEYNIFANHKKSKLLKRICSRPASILQKSEAVSKPYVNASFFDRNYAKNIPYG